MDYSQPGFSAPGISQAILEWGAMSMSKGFSQFRDQTHVSCTGRWILYHGAPRETMSRFSSVQLLSRVRLFATPWAAAHQASLFITNFRSLLKPIQPSQSFSSPPPLPSIFPSIRVFSRSQFFASGGQSIGAPVSASVLPMNTQD